MTGFAEGEDIECSWVTCNPQNPWLAGKSPYMIGPTFRRWLLAIASIVLFGPAQAGGSASVRVPFVGCPAIGGADIEARAAPLGDPVPLPGQPADIAARIAYYRAAGEEGLGVFAPRGWHCQAWSGASGAFIVVTPGVPKPVIPAERVRGEGVVAVESFGGTSGRFDVAEVSARLFPDVMAGFIARVKAEGNPSPDFSSIKPYADDRYTYLTPRLVRFTTPALHDGIGTGMFVPSADPVRGVVGLPPGDLREPNLFQYDLRLARSEDRLAGALVDIELRDIRGQEHR